MSKNDETTSKSILKQSIFSSIGTISITVISTLLITFLTTLSGGSTVEITVGESSLIGNSYFTEVTLTNELESTVESLELQLASDNNVMDIISEDAAITGDDAITIYSLVPSKDICVIVESENSIEKDALYCNTSVSTNLTFENSFRDTILLFSLMVGLYALINSISAYITAYTSKKQHQKHKEEIDTAQKEIETKCEYLQTEFDELQKEHNTAVAKHKEIDDDIKQLEKKRKKMQVYYELRIRDLKKELTFWRDTIRKMMYVSTGSFLDADKVIETITDELQTYTVRERTHAEIDEIFFIARELNECDENKNSPQSK